MADTSTYSLEERLLASLWTHDRAYTGRSMEDVRHEFATRFSKPAPPKRTILRWEHKLFLTGSIKDKPRTGRPSTQRDICAEVEASMQKSPKKSLRKLSSELGIPKTTMLTHLTKDLELKSLRTTLVNELSDNVKGDSAKSDITKSDNAKKKKGQKEKK